MHAPRPRVSRPSARLFAALAFSSSSLCSGAVLFSSAFDAYTSSSNDSVRVNGGADLAVAITGSGSNTASPSGYWSVANSAALDLAAVNRVEIPAALTGGSAFTYGDASLSASQLKKGAVFTTRADFTHTDGVNNAQVRYATSTAPNRGAIQLNSGALADARFNVFFEVKAGAPAYCDWSLAFRYGTAGTVADSWFSATAAQNGSATAAVYRLDPATGALDPVPHLAFATASLPGAGPTATLSATNPYATLNPGTYLLSISLGGKTQGQRYTLDDLSVSAATSLSTPATPTEVILDNPNLGVTSTGSWTAATTGGGYYGHNYVHDSQLNKGAKTIRFTPKLAAGVYAVSVRHPAAAGHDSAVPVDVAHAQGVDYLSLDQTTEGGEWRFLGNYRFDAGSSGYVEIGTAGTTGLVVADAVKFTPAIDPSDAEVLAAGLADWRTPDGDGITCAQCHGPAGYDIAVFSFNQADLRRATAPHLDDAAADRIFKMIELHRRNYPPAGGLKDVATFRPFQPGGGAILGGETASNEDRDAAFANHAAGNFLYAQGRLDTLAEAQAARDQLVALDIDSVPNGVLFNRWSESVSRQGAQSGGKIFEWLPAIGQQMGANQAAFQALEDTYVANPTDANFWAMFHKIDAWAQPDPHNSAPVVDPMWLTLSRDQLKSNLVFQHDQLLKSQGIDGFVTGRTSTRPFQDQEGMGSGLAFFWDVADSARVVKNSPLSELPQRDQDSIWLDPNQSEPLSRHINQFRLTWFWLGWTMDHSLFFSGISNATRSGEYFLEQIWTDNLRAHQVFFNTVHAAKRGFGAGRWNSGNSGGPVQYFTSHKPYYLAYNKYKKGVDAPGYPGSAATYKQQLANSVRMFALLHEQDIKDKGLVYGSGGKSPILANVDLMRQALDWADLANKAQNDAILDSLVATINAYPTP